MIVVSFLETEKKIFLDIHEILIRHSETSLFSNYLSYHHVDNVESVRSVDD